jgi:ubiquinone/menaquinone biosynthesis C-methylase UbiE
MDNRSEVLKDEYQARFQSNSGYRDSVWKLLCNLIFSRYITPEHVVLDLGAGWGEFSRNVAAKKKYAMDLNPDCGKRVDGFAEFIQQDCSRKWPLPDGSLDVVFTSNFLEHLPSKDLVDKTLAEAYRCLRNAGGGGDYYMCWAKYSLFARRILGLLGPLFSDYWGINGRGVVTTAVFN